MTDARTYKILLFEPSEMVAAGLQRMLAGSEFRVADTAATTDMHAVAELVRRHAPDIVVVNPSLMSDAARHGGIRSAVTYDTVFAALTYALFDEEQLREFDCTISVFDSQHLILRKLRKALERDDRTTAGESYELSEREREILISVACGRTNKEIADKHNISIHTVISHRKNISRKTGIKTIAGLTVYALLNNMITEADMA